MKSFNILFLFFLFISALKAQNENQKFTRFEKNINAGWTFNYFPDESADRGYESVGYNDSKWPVISLPHTWVFYETTGELFPFNYNKSGEFDPYWWSGWGWYRKHFIVNKNYSGKKIFIQFKGIQENCKVWINGTFLGDQKSTHNTFLFDITNNVKPGEVNVLAVAVSNRIDMAIAHNSIDNRLFSGISNDVSVILKNKIFIVMPLAGSGNNSQVSTGPQVSVKDGIVNISGWLKNEFPEKKNMTIQSTVSDASGRVIQVNKSAAVVLPGQLLKIEQAGKPLKNLHAWSKDDPYAYKVKIDILDIKEVADSWSMENGLRIGTSEEEENEDVWFLAGIEDVLKIKTGRTESEVKKPGTFSSRILLSGSVKNITADKASIAVVTANVTDNENNPAGDVIKTFKWKISGPGTLVGPELYESNISEVSDNENIWHGTFPVSNIIRSTGKPGIIHVTMSAPGLASGTFDITASELKSDNSVISESIPDDDGRKAVSRKTMDFSRLDEVPEEIIQASTDFNLKIQDQKGYEKSIADYIHSNNSSVDTSSVELKTLVSILSSQLINNKGQLSAFDYNFNIENYNNCRLISGYIKATKLPEFYKAGLRSYYADKIIAQGNQKNAGDEMNWLNWIPSGGTVVICRDGKPLSVPKGTILTEKDDLSEIITAVHPVFANYSQEAKERALEFISKMNPCIHNFKAEKGKPILIPLLKFISE